MEDTPRRATFTAKVSKPELKLPDTLYKYVAYQIDTTMESEPGAVTEVSVERRFSDFVWLQQSLAKQYIGSLIPPLPDKKVMGAVTGDRFSGDFVNERGRGLEQFLNRLAVHEQLRESADLKLFLTASAESLAQARTATKKPVVETAGMMSFFKQSVQSISSTFTGGAVEYSKDDNDIACDELLEYATHLTTQLSKVHTSAEDMVGKTRALGKCWAEFYLSCEILGQFEAKNEEQELGEVCTALGKVANNLSCLLSQKGEDENIHFREPVNDYLRFTEQVQELCRVRATVLQTYQLSLAAVQDCKNAVAALEGQAGKDEQQRRADLALLEAQATADSDKAELDRVTAATLSEAARFRKEKERDMRRIIVNFVHIQMNHSKQVQSAWESVLPVLSADKVAQ
jgi:hypothetical protein